MLFPGLQHPLADTSQATCPAGPGRLGRVRLGAVRESGGEDMLEFGLLGCGVGQGPGSADCSRRSGELPDLVPIWMDGRQEPGCSRRLGGSDKSGLWVPLHSWPVRLLWGRLLWRGP